MKLYGDAKIVKKEKVGKSNKSVNNDSKMANTPKVVVDHNSIDAAVKESIKIKGGTSKKIVINTTNQPKIKVRKMAKGKQLRSDNNEDISYEPGGSTPGGEPGPGSGSGGL
jgi:hypothetical protein